MAIDKSNPNTARIINYWVRGEGAARIRWGTDGSFDRCTRALAGKVRDPEGLCAELHKEATGEWPAEEGVPSSLDSPVTFELDPATFVELAAITPQPVITWSGTVAPADQPTGDGREFALGALRHRSLPLPAMFQEKTGAGHSDAVTIASMDVFEETPGGWRAEGEFLDPRVIPEVTKAIYLLQKRLARPSVDLESRMTYEIVSSFDANGNPDPLYRITEGTVIGVTFVAKPAFADLEIRVHDEEVGAILASSGIEFTPSYEFAASVNASSWQSMPLGERDQTFDADDAIVRLLDFSKGSVDTFSKAFLWRNPQGDPKNRDTYRLPIADVINGKVTLVPHAVYAAAALLSGAHGGLPGIPETDKEKIRAVVTAIYDHLRETFSDPRIKPMWQRGGRDGAEGTGDEGMKREASLADSPLSEFGVRSSGWDSLPMADASRTWDGPGAKTRLWAWADEDLGKFGRAFLWSAPDPKTKDDFKLPIADLIDGKLTIFPRALNAVASVLAGGRGGVDIPEADQTRIQGIVQRLQKRAGTGEPEQGTGMSMVASGAPERPPAAWFADPGFDGPTPLRVTDDGRVSGHLASWDTCHTGIGNTCVTPTRSRSDYRYFKTGYVVSDDGQELAVGKITLGGGHASLDHGYIPALEHYDDVCTAVAIVNAGEDAFGIWVAGALCPEIPDTAVAQLRWSPLSGDWRRIDGNLELIAALAVNTPGFPVVRASAAPDEYDAVILASAPTNVIKTKRDAAQAVQRVLSFARQERLNKILGG